MQLNAQGRFSSSNAIRLPEQTLPQRRIEAKDQEIDQLAYELYGLNREFGLGRRRTDLLLEWPLDEAQGFFGSVQRVVIELKLLHARKSLESILAEGLEQTADYADKVGADEAHLVIFSAIRT